MRRWKYSALACVLTACAPKGKQSSGVLPEFAQLEGVWRVCFTEASRSDRPACGTLVARPYTGTRAGRVTQGYFLKHDIALAALLGSAEPVPAHGAAHLNQLGGWTLLLGVDEGITEAIHSGLHARLAWSGDSLVGGWALDGYAGHEASWRIVMFPLAAR